MDSARTAPGSPAGGRDPCYRSKGEKELVASLRTLTAIIILLTAAGRSDAGSTMTDYGFTRYSQEQGLSQGSVRSIEQDGSGFLWIATQDGLNRFDGYNFAIFNHNPFDSTSLTSNRITSVHADRDGNLWVGTAKGLNLMSPGSHAFRRFVNEHGEPGTMAHNLVNCLHRDRRGGLWVGTPAGLDRMDVRTRRFDHFRHDPSDRGSISDDHIRCLLEDTSGHIWVGTRNGLNRFDYSTGRFERFDFARHFPDPDVRITKALAEKGPGQLLVGTHAGLLELDVGQGSVRRIRLRDSRDGSAAGGRGHPSVADVLLDSSGRLWAATYSGLYVIARGDTSATRLKHDPGDPSSLSHDTVTCLFQDEGEVVWAGTIGYGLNAWSPYLGKFKRYGPGDERVKGLNFKSVRAIYEDPTGIVWIGGYGGGLNRLDLESEDFSQAGLVPSGNIYTILGDPDHPDRLLWIGTEGSGLVKYDILEQTSTSLPVRPGDRSGLDGRNVYALCAGPEGRLWIGTDKGVNLFDRSEGRFDLVDCRPRGGSVRAISRDGRNAMWVGTTKGLARLDHGAEEFVFYRHDPSDRGSLSDDYVLCVHEDSEGAVWIGTNGGGLNKFLREGETFTHYMQGEGLPNNVVYGILEDGQGHLWISTNAGISHLDPVSETFRNFTLEDGLQSLEFNASAYHRGPSGNLYFGGVEGFNVIEPRTAKDNPHPPRVAVTEILLSRTTSPHRGGEKATRLLPGPAAETETLELTHENRVVSFELSALDFTHPRKNSFAYKLEGLDENWNLIGHRRFITFTDLSPGDYSLYAKAANSDGIWGEPVSLLRMHIAPPIWRTWWFRAAPAAAFLLAVFALHRIRTTSIRRHGAEVNRSREFLNSIVNALDDPVYVKDGEHRWVVLNDRACEMMGRPREELLGKTDHDVLPRQQAEAHWREDDEAFANGNSVITSEFIADWQDEPRVISTKKSAFTEPSTGKRFIACTVRDITELKRYEAALEDRLRFESVASGISAELINPPASDVDKVIGQGLSEIGEFFAADRVVIRLMKGEDGLPAKVYARRLDSSRTSMVREDFEAAFPNLVRRLMEGREIVFERTEDLPREWKPELRHLGKLGIKSGIVVPLSVGGSHLGSISVMMVGSERKWEEASVSRVRTLGETMANALNRKRAEEALRQSRQKYWSILENIGIGIALIDTDLRILERNKKMREWFPGLQDDRLPFCQEPHCLPPDRHDCPIVRTLRDGKVHEETTTVSLEDRSATFRVVSSPIRTADGEVIAAIEMAEDITEKLNLEDQLRHSQKMEAIGTLAGGIAHDFNNILYAILGYANLAKGRISSDQTSRGYIEQIEVAGKRAAGLVEQILASGRHSDNKPQPLSLQKLTDEALTLLRGSLPATVEVRQRVSPDCGPVLADSSQIHQVIMNLCTNAYQAMPDRKGVLEVRLDEVLVDEALASKVHGMRPGAYARLSVIDDGDGMEPAVVKRIFEPYFTTKRPGEGSGLGLAMAHGIIESNQGAIHVSSELGRGTTFEVYLPICEGSAPEEEEPSVDEEPAPSSATILFVDDEPIIVDMCETILRNRGYSVDAYRDGEQALDAFRRNPSRYDLVLADVTMPRLTGIELAERIRSICKDIPIVLCTGRSDSVNRRTLRELDISTCLGKPVDSESLTGTIRRLLRTSSVTEV